MCFDAGNEPQDSDSGDLNKLLFSAIVQSNWTAIQTTKKSCMLQF